MSLYSRELRLCVQFCAQAAMVAALGALGSGAVRAGMILGTPQVSAEGGVSVVGDPSIGLTGTGTPADPFKISGHADFLNDDSGPAVVRVLGELTAEAGEELTASYDMTVDWNPDFEEGLAEFIFRGAILLDPLPSIPIQFAQGIFEIGSHQYQGAESFEIPADIGPVAFQLEMYIYIGQLGTLSLDIPANSIDVSLGPPVPEPGGAALAGVGAAWGLGRWRRRVSR